MCTRLVINTIIRKRWFMIYDRNKPFELSINIKKENPKNETDVSLGWSIHGPIPIITESATFTKELYIRKSSLKEVQDLADKINNGTFCFKCGHPSSCTKKMFRDWSK